ncbi:MAG: glycosyltransferase family 1 protein [Candidatus Electrothrix sp. ATG2]|nr:glycosyltransferase family 1 protein [Candidatus Electrothrix sp. ATG2]
MKILFLSKYYDNYLNYFFSVHNPDQYISYSSLYNKIIRDRYFWSDYFKQELPVYGYNVEQLIVDAKPLQIRWAEEHQASYSEDNWYFDIILEQIKEYKPEILFIQDWAPELGSEFIQLVKGQCPSVKVVIGYCGDGHPSPSYFKEHDFVISCAKDNVDLFNRNGLTAYHIYHAFFPGILNQLDSTSKIDSELGFIGRVNPSSQFHKQRALFLACLSESVPFSIHGEIIGVERKYYSFKEALYDGVFQFGSWFFDYKSFQNNKYVANYLQYKESKFLNESLVRLQRYQGKQYLGLKMFDVLRRYRMLLNYHISPVCAANLRLFEVTGMGTCLITDWKENIVELFEPDTEVVTFRSVEEAKDKITFLLKNPDVIKSISQAGQKRTLRDHTYAKRAQDMHNIFSDYLKNHYKSN